MLDPLLVELSRLEVFPASSGGLLALALSANVLERRRFSGDVVGVAKVAEELPLDVAFSVL